MVHLVTKKRSKHYKFVSMSDQNTITKWPHLNTRRAAFRRVLHVLRNGKHLLNRSLPKRNHAIRLYATVFNLQIEGGLESFLMAQYFDVNSPIGKPVKDEGKKVIERKKKDYKDRYAKYKAYLLSPEWRVFRKQILSDRGSKCENCGFDKVIKLHIHHLTYDRLYNELPEDVKILCRRCHESVHERKFTDRFAKKKPSNRKARKTPVK
jgi:5-methylcytosine-specific restriction endonuclease McrA